MAPAVIMELPFPVSPLERTMHNGQALEATSDSIDSVNALKVSILESRKATNKTVDSPISANAYAASQFDAGKDKSQFRQYLTACQRVQDFYAEQHQKQTVSYNLYARAQFRARGTRAELTVWEAIEKLNSLIDESDPDTELSQIEHLLQSAEALRRDGKPRWMQLTGLIHDLGKLLFFYGARGQWDVVGDTFPVGCAFSPSIIYPETFSLNPDSGDAIYTTEHGIYYQGCGLDNVMLSWGHDEYLYHVVKEAGSRLPEEALAIIRYHSFYPWHREGAYAWMMEEKDHRMLEAVKVFNPYDLYSKSDEVPKMEELKDYYTELIDEFFGNDKKLRW